MFYYRHSLTRGDLTVHSTVNEIRGNDRPITMGITGSSRYLGSSLIPFLTTWGHRVIRFIIRRSASHNDDNGSNQQNVKFIQWDPSSDCVDAFSLNDKIDNSHNMDAVVEQNTAINEGYNIALSYWTIK